MDIEDFSQKLLEIINLEDAEFIDKWKILFFVYLGGRKVDLVGIGDFSELISIALVKDRIRYQQGRLDLKDAYRMHVQIMANMQSNGMLKGDRLAEQFNDISTAHQDAKNAWIATLRSQGIKGAHPDDGWVDRENSQVCLMYPQFLDEIEVGDLFALGSLDRHKIVRITEIGDGWMGTARLTFAEIGLKEALELLKFRLENGWQLTDKESENLADILRGLLNKIQEAK